MKFRPMLFKGSMVRALLADTKTQTRRIAPLNTEDGAGEPCQYRMDDRGFVQAFIGEGFGMEKDNPDAWMLVQDGFDTFLKCPYGQPGDRLWVRETWAHTHLGDGSGLYVYPVADPQTDYGGPWKPSIHMPRAASRITLDITGVRVERLQAISEADALAEGVVREQVITGDTAKAAYRRLWESINGPGSWDLNPWVWVVNFKRAVTP